MTTCNVTETPVSLPKFLNENPGLPPYGVLCLRARTEGIPGVVKNPTGFGWVVTNSELTLQAIRKQKS